MVVALLRRRADFFLAVLVSSQRKFTRNVVDFIPAMIKVADDAGMNVADVRTRRRVVDRTRHEFRVRV